VAVNPYKMFDIYGLDQVKLYEGRILGTLPPLVFTFFSTNKAQKKISEKSILSIKNTRKYSSHFL